MTFFDKWFGPAQQDFSGRIQTLSERSASAVNVFKEVMDDLQEANDGLETVKRDADAKVLELMDEIQATKNAAEVAQKMIAGNNVVVAKIREFVP